MPLVATILNRKTLYFFFACKIKRIVETYKKYAYSCFHFFDFANLFSVKCNLAKSGRGARFC